MQLKEFLKWNRRFSILYAAGVWTMIGSYGYFRYTGKDQDQEGGGVEVNEAPADENQVEFRTAHVRTVIVYKKDFVPYTTRIYNFFQSLSGAPQTEPDTAAVTAAAAAATDPLRTDGAEAPRP